MLMKVLSLTSFFMLTPVFVYLTYKTWGLKKKYQLPFLNIFFIYLVTFHGFVLFTHSVKIVLALMKFKRPEYIGLVLNSLFLPVLFISFSLLWMFFRRCVQKPVTTPGLMALILFHAIMYGGFLFAVFQRTIISSQSVMIVRISSGFEVAFLFFILIEFLLNVSRLKDPIPRKFFKNIGLMYLLLLPPTIISIEFFDLPFMFSDYAWHGYIIAAVLLLMVNIPAIIYIHYFLKKNPSLNIQNKINNQFLSRLTAKEQEIVKLIIHGKTNQEIGDILFLSEKTVKNYVTAIYKKTGAKNRVQLTGLSLG